MCKEIQSDCPATLEQQEECEKNGCLSICVTPDLLTAEVLQDEVQLAPRLEGVDEIHDERMLHFLQNVPLCLGVGRVLSIAYNHSLQGPKTFMTISHANTASLPFKKPHDKIHFIISSRNATTLKNVLTLTSVLLRTFLFEIKQLAFQGIFAA